MNATSSLPVLGLLEAHDRHGNRVAQLAITGWPVTVGRALTCDLVLDDPHVAPQHLLIERVAALPVQAGQAPWPWQAPSVRVLHTCNGVQLGPAEHASGSHFDWASDQSIPVTVHSASTALAGLTHGHTEHPVAGPAELPELRLGRVRLTLRLADMALPPELPNPRFAWGSAALTAALVSAFVGWVLINLWFGTPQTDKFAQSLPFVVAGGLGVLGVWGGLWALASKLFAGHPHFWQHVRIAATAALAEGLLSGGANLLAFMFSLESLARFDYLASGLVFATGLYLQLSVVVPQRTTMLRGIVAVLFAGAVVASLGTNWLQSKRLSSGRPLTSMFPPSLRLAPTVPVAQFTEETRALKQRLEERLKDEESADGVEEEVRREE